MVTDANSEELGVSAGASLRIERPYFLSCLRRRVVFTLKPVTNAKINREYARMRIKDRQERAPTRQVKHLCELG
jgi:hypothetical protein